MTKREGMGHASRASLAWLVLVPLVACGGQTAAPSDGGTRNANRVDSGAAEAMGTPGRTTDGSATDATVTDARDRESGTPDGRGSDVHVNDAGDGGEDAGTTFTFDDGGADAACSCHYHGLEPSGPCTEDGLVCGPPWSCGGGCGPQACTCTSGVWACVPVPPC